MPACPNCGSLHDGPCALQAGQTVRASIDERPQINAAKVLQGRYELLHVLGQGGMGTVFMARDLRLKGRNCVVKKLRDDFYREEDRKKAQAFFEREMHVLSELQHTNIVQILDYFCEASDYYLVMEYVQGNNLHYMLHQERHGEPFSVELVIKWMHQICYVLEYLHSQSPPVIYRDLKPSNIMIDLKDQVKLVDFGIARTWEENGEHTHVVSAGYSPPEQYWGAADPRSDIYSLGATMYFLLTGKDPDALHGCSPRQANSEVPESVDFIVQKATSQDPNERFQSINELSEALLHYDYEPAPDSPRSRIGEIATFCAVAVVSVLVYLFICMPAPEVVQKPEGSHEPLLGEMDTTTPYGNPRRTNVEVQPAQTGPVTTDLAVQMIDEKDMTDPEALQAQKQEEQQQPFSLGFPWQKKR